MNPADRETLFQFLGGYWYDREEPDAAILQEFLADVDAETAQQLVRCLRDFLASPAESETAKAAFVRDLVWRWFPPDSPEAPLRWLTGIADQLTALLSLPPAESAAGA